MAQKLPEKSEAKGCCHNDGVMLPGMNIWMNNIIDGFLDQEGICL